MTRAGIVDAALRVTQRTGLDGLTMRALADELDTSTMSIYHYVPNKDALTKLVVVEVLSQIRVPGPEAGRWDERLKLLEHAARDQLRRHPGVGAVLVEHGGALESSRLAKGVIDILRDAGFDDDTAYKCFVTMYTYMVGQLDLDGVRAVQGPGDASTIGEVVEDRRFDADELFEFGFETMMEGLRARLQRHRKQQRDRAKVSDGSPAPRRRPSQAR